MPWMICKTCSQEKSQDQFRLRKKLGIFYRSCRACEIAKHKEWQTDNLDWYREKNKRSYLNWSTSFRARRNMEALLRHRRTRVASRGDELTEFVFEEAYLLSRLREQVTGIKWHIDHILPLKGRTISGLHVWNNLQVIPASVNLSKGNKEMAKFLG